MCRRTQQQHRMERWACSLSPPFSPTCKHSCSPFPNLSCFPSQWEGRFFFPAAELSAWRRIAELEGSFQKETGSLSSQNRRGAKKRCAAMPSEQGPPPQGPPSKPAKERSNHAAAAVGLPKASGRAPKGPGAPFIAKAAQGKNGTTAGRGPASETEKDSGFSDVSSEYLSAVDPTDTEDPSLLSSSSSSPKALAKGPFPGMAPVYIVKNVILKQQLDSSSPGSPFLTWSGQHPMDASVGSAAHILLIQPPVSSSLKPLLSGPKPASSKEAYLPILSAFPKIAPHPGPDGAKKNKRFCLEDSWTSSSEAKDGEQTPPETHNAVSSSTGSDSKAEGRMISRASKKLGSSSAGKQRRFHNTVEILRKSGLLGITLRTKELIRQNNATQRELAELREQAQLLCEAVQSNEAGAWTRLQEAMDRSATYWAKKGNGNANTRQSKESEAQGSVPNPDAASTPADSPMNLTLTPDISAPLP
ncbi:CLOCK-interacting pacemaker isoform X1 [Anolis sagrei]|uniref:CLOCK-interacting pacemaker isoform X1 n=2 Tax=Anolis sagrei TaxID=38937 RepID=UPI00351FF07E